MPVSYSVVRFECREHRESMASLFDRNLSGGSRARVEWFYDQNPETPITSLATADGEAAVGSASLLRLAVKIGDATGRGAVAVDFNIDAAHRGFGPALKLQRALVSAIDDGEVDLALAFPNQDSAPVLRRVGYREIGVARAFVKVLRSRYVVARHVKSEGLRHVAAGVIDAGIRLRDWWALWSSQGRRRLTGQPLPGFDARFDRLWERAKHQCRLLVERRAAYLEWRYSRSPLKKHGIYAVGDAGGTELRGYLVHHTEGATAIVDDFFFEGESAGRQLFLGFFAFARRAGARSVSVGALDNARTARFLVSQGCVPRPASRAVLLYCSAGNSRFADWGARDDWHLADGDLDL